MKSPAEVLKMAGVDPKVGLSDERVASLRAMFGSNVLPSKEKVPLWKRFLEQFDDKMVKILLVAAGISTMFAVVDYGTEAHPFVEPLVIMSILVLNAGIGVWQESSAEAAIDALATFNPEKAKVRSASLYQKRLARRTRVLSQRWWSQGAWVIRISAIRPGSTHELQPCED
ncbi:hypothetical protein T484DRAFT_1627106 [Baffinella frigidus]|nr:hypothetical protein T484DRAFT_1627106 [Cryptophyta sp. CCMP2293]